MARATRSSTADLKRKRSFEDIDNSEHGPNKQPRTIESSYQIDGHALLTVLETEDTQGLLDRVFPVPDSDNSASLRSLLTTSTPISILHSAIQQLKPISSLPRAKLSPTAEQQLRFCNLALSLLEQLPSTDIQNKCASLPDTEASPPRPRPSYALVQHLPAADYWSSVLHNVDNPPKNLHTANAELVAILPAPSSSKDAVVPTLGSYSTKPLSQKKPPLAQRRVTASTFLDYGLYTSFAPSFDEDGEVVGKEQLGQVLWYREERKRLRDAVRRERLEGTGSIVDITPEPHIYPPPQDESPPDLELDSLLPPEDVEAIKAALNNLELEKSVQTLLNRNQRALERLEELQFQRLTKHPTSNAEEDSEEWETAQAILDSLTLLASLRPRSSSEDHPAIIPSTSVLHKLHLTLSLEPSPGWYGTLPPGRSTALRDDSTVKVRPGAAIPTPAANTPSTPASTSTANTFGAYPYPYPQQQQTYRPQQAPAYTPFKPAQTPSYYQSYLPGGQQQNYYSQQSYASGTGNQQPYGAAIGQQQQYGNYSQWYGQFGQASSGTGSGRGTPQPTATTLPTNVATSYGSFFNNTPPTAAVATTSAVRTPAIANTVVGNTASAGSSSYNQTPTFPAQRNAQSPAVNGTGYPPQQGYYASYQMQTQPAR